MFVIEGKLDGVRSIRSELISVVLWKSPKESSESEFGSEAIVQFQEIKFQGRFYLSNQKEYQMKRKEND